MRVPATGVILLAAVLGGPLVGCNKPTSDSIQLWKTTEKGPGKLADALLCERPDLPVLFMSGHSYDALRDRAVGPDLAFSLLHKPFGPEDLNRAVRDRLAASPDD